MCCLVFDRWLLYVCLCVVCCLRGVRCLLCVVCLTCVVRCVFLMYWFVGYCLLIDCYALCVLFG